MRTVRVHPQIWIVVRSNGEHHLLEKEPIEGIDVWAKGQDVTVIEYRFNLIRYPKNVTATPNAPAIAPPAP
jgi:hypothetical protein